MTRKLFVGGLSWSRDEDEVTVVRDHASGRSRGFGFVVFDDDARGAAALEEVTGRKARGKRPFQRREDPRPLPQPTSHAPVPLIEPIDAWNDDRPRRRQDRKRKRWWDDDDELVERQPRKRRGGRSWCFAEKDEW